MFRTTLFLTGLAVILIALPQSLRHHEMAALLELAWCSADGTSRASAAFLGGHCAACPALLAGLFMVVISPFARRRTPARRPAAK
ncbi:MAG: hypothetical protein WA989_11915 [Henriciella sp.]|uniref:hypothetical protein n=1 Tax=Henriciella sp. TaxID=1968823 RepID=UPI003C73738F